MSGPNNHHPHSIAMGRRVLLLEPVGGISGDMFLGAALDLGVPVEALEVPLRSLNLGDWRLEVMRAHRHALMGTHVEVVVPHEEGGDHGDGHHSHAHGDATVREREHGHHRAWKDINALIASSALAEGAKDKALRVFRALACAEGKIHGMPPDDVEFHEVGAVDSIIDICGAALALEALGNPTLIAAPPPLGSGTTQSAHGILPVPAPATLELLRGFQVKFEGKGELTTPTGAALLSVLATVGPFPDVVVERIGYGVGTRDTVDRANVLRATLGEAHADGVSLSILECNLDDCSPQLLGAVIELALTRGALDAWVTPVVMKKGRPGHVVSLLSDAQHKAALMDTLFDETTTLGVREVAVSRTALERSWESVATPWGHVRIKLGRLNGRVVTATPEFDDCLAIARNSSVRLRDVQAAATLAWKPR